MAIDLEPAPDPLVILLHLAQYPAGGHCRRARSAVKRGGREEGGFVWGVESAKGEWAGHSVVVVTQESASERA